MNLLHDSKPAVSNETDERRRQSVEVALSNHFIVIKIQKYVGQGNIFQLARRVASVAAEIKQSKPAFIC